MAEDAGRAGHACSDQESRCKQTRGTGTGWKRGDHDMSPSRESVAVCDRSTRQYELLLIGGCYLLIKVMKVAIV